MLHSTLMLALALATLGNVNKQRKLPPPRVYAAISIVWWVLGTVADMGPRLARLAGVFSGVLVLTMMTGKAGKRLVAWLQGRAVAFGGAAVATGPSGAGEIFSSAFSAFTGAAGATAQAGGFPRTTRTPLRTRTPADKGTLAQNPRWTTQATRAAINRRTPSGQVAHLVMQEGTVTYRGGHPGVMVKFWTPAGYDTRWTRID